MNRFEQITATIDNLAAFFEEKMNACERSTPCNKCSEKQWCDCVTAKDFKKYLSEAAD